MLEPHAGFRFPISDVQVHAPNKACPRIRKQNDAWRYVHLMPCVFRARVRSALTPNGVTAKPPPGSHQGRDLHLREKGQSFAMADAYRPDSWQALFGAVAAASAALAGLLFVALSIN